MFLADYHLHSNFSTDSDAEMCDIAEQAVAIGLNEIAFTDHVDFDYPTETNFEINIDKYISAIEAIAEKYKSISIKKGIELGLQNKSLVKNQQLIKNYNFDFVIGSTHVADNLDLYCGDFFTNKERLKAYERYFEVTLENIKQFDGFDVYGHIDYVNRYGGYAENDLDFSRFRGFYEEIFKALIEKGKGIEINTSGFKYGLNTFHPQYKALELYKSLGGDIITLGSDAHKPEHIALKFDYAVDCLKEIGFNAVAVFSQRKISFVDIG